MDYFPGYRCPVCGSKLYGKTFENRKLIKINCDVTCQWSGTPEEADKIGDEQFALEAFLSENELRFAHAQFSEEDIAFSAFLAGIEYHRKVNQ